MKGKNDSKAGGGEIMTTEQHEEHKQHTFDCFCKRTLKYEAYNAYREIRRRQHSQFNSSELRSAVM